MISFSLYLVYVWTGAADALAARSARPSACPVPDQHINVTAEDLAPCGTRPSAARESINMSLIDI